MQPPLRIELSPPTRTNWTAACAPAPPRAGCTTGCGWSAPSPTGPPSPRPPAPSATTPRRSASPSSASWPRASPAWPTAPAPAGPPRLSEADLVALEERLDADAASRRPHLDAGAAGGLAGRGAGGERSAPTASGCCSSGATSAGSGPNAPRPTSRATDSARPRPPPTWRFGALAGADGGGAGASCGTWTRAASPRPCRPATPGRGPARGRWSGTSRRQGAGSTCWGRWPRTGAARGLVWTGPPGKIDSAVLLDFIWREVAGCRPRPTSCRRGTGGRGRCVIVLDNASAHTSKAVKAALPALEAAGVTLYYLPPYSPELNRIEELWRHVKYQELPAAQLPDPGRPAGGGGRGPERPRRHLLDDTTNFREAA